MNNSNSSESPNNRPSSIFWNVVGLAATYIVILIFCAKQISDMDKKSPEVVLQALADGVCISTFTYILTQAINNLVGNMSLKAQKVTITMLVADIPYILLYGVFNPRSICLNIILCIYTVGLIVWAFISISLMSNGMEKGQTNEHMMEQERNTRGSGCVSDERSPES